jgi:hypothetical protein
MRPAPSSSRLPAVWLADGITPVGYSALDGLPGFKLSIKQAGDRWYLYLGHFWHSGWSVLDVTDPGEPEVGRFIRRFLRPARMERSAQPESAAPQPRRRAARRSCLPHLLNAGLRIFDVSQPRLPREVAWFLPPDPARRLGPQPPSELVAQSEDVLVDRRGFIYLSDKNQGLWILRSQLPGHL